MGFPEVKFGICQECGGQGADQTVGLTDADAAARDTSGNGTELQDYKGRKLCPLCIQRLKDDEKSLQDAKRHAEAEKFRGRAGFENSIT